MTEKERDDLLNKIEGKFYIGILAFVMSICLFVLILSENIKNAF